MSSARHKIAAGEPPSQHGSAWFCTPTSSRFPAHYHDDYELNVVMRGTLTYVVDGKVHELGAGGRIWLLPAAEHELVDLSPDAAFWVFTFKAALVRDQPWAARAPLSAGSLRDRRAAPEVLRAIAELGCEIVKHRRSDVTNGCLTSLLSLPWNPSDRPESSRAQPALATAASLLADLRAPAPIAAIAERCGLSHEHFTRSFTRAFGVPPVYYRNHQRVQGLIQLMDDAGSNLLHTALRVGFGSYAQFHRAFVQVTSQGPRAALQRRRERLVLPARVSLRA